MSKRKTMTIAILPAQRKSLGYFTLDQKLGKNLKSKAKTLLLSYLART